MIETNAQQQPYEVDDLDGAGVLGELDYAEVADRAAARRKFRLVYQWAVLNPGTPETTATWGDGEPGPGRECEDPLGGEGSPLVASPAVPRLGAAMGIALATALAWIADVIDVVHRLPRIHARVEALEVPVWKARKVASMTRSLSAVAAAAVDERLAPRLDQVGFPTIARVIAEAVAVFHPDRVKDPDRSPKAQWGVRLDHGTGEHAGSSWIEACGDTLDLIDLHDLACRIAEALRREGDQDSLEQRKAKALGLIGRGDYQELLDRHPGITTLAKTGDDETDSDDRDEDTTVPATPRRRWKPRRPGARTKVFIHIHARDLDPDDDEDADLPDDEDPDRADADENRACRDPEGSEAGPDGCAGAVRRGRRGRGRARVGHVERLGTVPLAVIRRWVGGRAGVRIQPVIWMDSTDAVDAHDPPEWMAELVRLRDPHCVFPGCQRDSRSCDLDHIEPYIDGPNAPPGQTHPGNLAPLCRGHHNAKTHLGWRYRRLPNGSYLWRAPDGSHYLVDTKGSVIYRDPP